MSILKSILSESKGHYLDVKKKIELKLAVLPKGSVKERRISNRKYYYLQYRIDKKIVHKYLGKNKPKDIFKQIQERKKLKEELKKVKNALKILKRTKSKKRD